MELVLDRLQKDKDAQHNNEILKYQDTIKQNAILIHNYQKDLASCQVIIKFFVGLLFLMHFLTRLNRHKLMSLKKWWVQRHV